MATKFLFFPEKECADIPKISKEASCCRENLKPSSDEQITVYRALKKSDIIRNEFTPQLAMQPLMSRVLEKPCNYCGLSVFLSEEAFAAFFATRRIAAAFKFSAIGKIIETEHGPIEERPCPPHVTWHPYIGTSPENLFQLNSGKETQP